jgi:hypothetical protein
LWSSAGEIENNYVSDIVLVNGGICAKEVFGYALFIAAHSD